MHQFQQNAAGLSSTHSNSTANNHGTQDRKQIVRKSEEGREGGLVAYVVVGLLAAVGALLRWGISEKAALLGWWPWGTLIVNVLGSLLVGVFYVMANELHLLPPIWRDGLMIGFCGALTTFSTYSLEILRLTEDDLWGQAAMLLVLNNSLTVGACALAIWGLRSL